MRFLQNQLRLEQFELEADRAQILAQQEIEILKRQPVGGAFGLRGGDAGLGDFGILLGAREDAAGYAGFCHPGVLRSRRYRFKSPAQRQKPAWSSSTCR